MMHKTGSYNYGETSSLQILELDYLSKDLSMLIILPKENNLNAIENTLDIEGLNIWKKEMKTEEVRITLPKFRFATKYFMAKDLKEMGMPSAFKYPDADFTGISAGDDLYIGEVIHQAYIEVAEYGTEAAAATGVFAEVISAQLEEQPKLFTADRPFIFIIQQKATENILFMGRLSNPSR